MGAMKQYLMEQAEKELEQTVRDWFRDKYGHEPTETELVNAWNNFEMYEALAWAMEKDD